MAIIRAYGYFVAFTLPNEVHVHVSISKDLFTSRFNLQIGPMYVEQKMYFVVGDISETILLQKIMIDDGHSWILDP